MMKLGNVEKVGVVLDCNVIISAGLGSVVCTQVLDFCMKNCLLFCSNEIFSEYAEVISRKKFRNNFNDLRNILINLSDIFSFVGMANTTISLPDKNDEIYIKTALECQADFLVTGNLKHFPERKYESTEVLSPRDFLSYLKSKRNKKRGIYNL